ncbi:polysaccharide deacetylase family protein [Yinghuangia sp. ASG 101]|uniref:polysaccharide deacetylase family protein n=1 Tax=Yinghuangia sp. ASG 101 TaxID=2896848 RepID=UPI0022B22A31|nr:polysaccharide deacetylase family protein [Yinghuangia sp. ASG 101]
MPALPIRSATFQAAVVAIAVFLCGFLVWTASADTVDARPASAAPTPDTTGQPPGPPTPPPPPLLPAEPPSPPAPPTPPVPTTLQSKVGRTDPGKWVALTFDDGPWAGYTTQVLDTLDHHAVKAVFCVVGAQAQARPDLIREIVARGHTLCNHTMTHDTKMPEHSPEEIRSQMQRTLDAIHAAVPDAAVPWYRAPAGNWAPHVQEAAAFLGMRSLGWSVDTLDWKKPGVDKILHTIGQQVTPGGVILLHDGGGDRTMSVEALRRLIPDLLAKGYQFTVPV